MTGDRELNGRRALVTGGTKGIGEAVVAALRDAGAQVLITARSRRPRQPIPACVPEAYFEVSALPFRAFLSCGEPIPILVIGKFTSEKAFLVRKRQRGETNVCRSTKAHCQLFCRRQAGP